MGADAGKQSRAGEQHARYLLDRYAVEQRGRLREIRGSVLVAVGLVVTQWPLRQVAMGHAGSAHFDPMVALRLSVLVDLGLILAYLMFGYRCWGLVRSRRAPDLLRRPAQLAASFVLPAGAALDLTEDLVLWFRTPPDNGNPLTVAGLTDAMHLLVLLGVATVGLCAILSDTRLWWVRSAETGSDDRTHAETMRAGLSWPWGVGRGRLDADQVTHDRLTFAAQVRIWRDAGLASEPGLVDATSADVPSERADRVICCSGGGIRSGAFSLGGLQSLAGSQPQDRYQSSQSVIGVSGGGYVAAAYHLMRLESDTGALNGDSPFAPGSPELHWLRRHTRYVLDSARAATQAVLSLAYGIAVNLVLLTAAIGGTAWLLAALYGEAGRLTYTGSTNAPFVTGGFEHGLGYLQLIWALPTTGASLFLVEKFWDRFATIPQRMRRRLQGIYQALLVVGGALTFLVLGVAFVLQHLQDFALGSDSPFARLVLTLGLVDEKVCQDLVEAGHAACGAPGSESLGSQAGTVVFSTGTIGAMVSAVVAVLGAVRGSAKGQSDDGSWLSKFAGRIWAKIKDPIVPWLAAVGVGLVTLVVLLRWVARLAQNPGALQRLLEGPVVYVFVGLLIVLRVFAEPNRTSLHHFFRERIAYAFLVRRHQGEIVPIPYERPLRFSRLKATDGPQLVSCAVANATDEAIVPSQRGCTPFVFDSEEIGLTDRLLPAKSARRASRIYEFAADPYFRDATVPAAIAMSAAAFSPLAGRENVRLGPFRLVMALGNARLGVWLPNPLWTDHVELARRQVRMRLTEETSNTYQQLSSDERILLRHTLSDSSRTWLDAVLSGGAPDEPRVAAALFEGVRSVFKKPSITRVVKEAFGRASVYDRFLYITDGGHYDNLGLIEALRRRPRRIYVLDASNDPEDTFRALGQAVATARMDLDCEVVLDPRPMRRLQEKRSAAAWCAGVARYQDGTHGAVFIVKAIMLEGLSWDVETYAGANLDFPRTSTTRQLYSEFDFEAYRRLGQSAMLALLGSQIHQQLDEAAASDGQLALRLGEIQARLESSG
jgi:hypothetical protein